MKTRCFLASSLFIGALFGLSIHPYASAAANPLAGEYFGAATIESPAGLGSVDLAFHLELDAAGNIIADSYIMLDKTLLFPKVAPQVGGIDVGPRVSGKLTLTSGLDLTSDDFTTKIFAGTASEKTVTRQITLDGSTVSEGGNSVSGAYTETMTGYLPETITVAGTFVLVRPVAITEGMAVCQDTLEPFWELTLDEIKAGGKDPAVVEFEDLSCAMYHKRNGSSGLSVSDQVMTDVIINYKNSLQ